MTKIQTMFEAGRRVSAPFFACNTADQTAAIEELSATVDESSPILQWDAVRGITHINTAGERLGISSDDTIPFAEAMNVALTLPRSSVLFCRNAHRQLHSAEPLQTAVNVQGVLNLRDRYALDHRALVLVGPQVTLPIEFAQDTVILKHALPTASDLRSMIRDLMNRPDLPKVSNETIESAVEAVRGLSSFAAETAVSMSLSESVGIDVDQLWERKLENIDQGAGTTAYRGGEKFSDIVGLEGIIANLNLRKKAKRKINVIVVVDEVDKAFANAEGDSGNNVRMNQIRTLLVEWENNEWEGFVGLGPAGGGKTLIGKAFGNELGVPTIWVDFGEMMSKYVGESEAQMAAFINMLKALAGDGIAYAIMTSNNASVMRPELQRRMTDGMWFFDIMTKDERAAAWSFYIKKYNLRPEQFAQMPDDDGWTAAEIRNCCRKAWNVDCTLIEASQFIVPMSRGRADSIEELRRYAHGRFLDASKGGIYTYTPDAMRRAVRGIAIPKSASVDRKGGTA